MRTAVAMMLLAAGLCACGPQGQGPPAGKDVKTVTELSRAKTYHAIQALSRDSDVVVVGLATSAVATDQIAGLDFKVRTLTVQQTFKGQVASDSLKLRQVGGGQTGSVSDVPLAEVGATYLLFLQRFHPAPGQTSDEFVVTGLAAGIYQMEGGLARRLDPESTDLPDSVALPTLPSLIQ